MSYELLANVTGNIVGEPVELARGGFWTLNIEGGTGDTSDFGGGTLQVQVGNSEDANNWNTITYNGAPLSITDFTPYSLNWLGNTLWVRAVLSGATTDVNLKSVTLF